MTRKLVITSATAAFSLSCIGVVAAYSPLMGVFEGFFWRQALRDLPLVGAAALNVAATFLVLFGAFWSCRGSKEIYRDAVFGYSFLCPWLVILFALPGEQAKPDWASLHWGAAFAFFFAAQYGCARLLREWVWLRGGRSTA